MEKAKIKEIIKKERMSGIRILLVFTVAIFGVHYYYGNNDAIVQIGTVFPFIVVCLSIAIYFCERVIYQLFEDS